MSQNTDASAQSAAPQRAGRRAWIGLVVLVLPVLLTSIDIGALYFAIPFVSADLEPSGVQQLWIMDAYGFVLAGMLVTMGALGDRIGRRRLLLCGVAGFGLASLAAAYASNAVLLIVARGALGLAGATLMPSTMALIRSMFRDRVQRRTALAIWSSGMAAGTAIGPVLGGVLLEHFWWGSVFLINVPVMVVLLIAGRLVLPEYRDRAAGRLDLPSAVLSLAAILAVVYGLKTMAEDGLEVVPALAVVAGLLLAYAFVRRQLRLPDPMLDLGLFRRHGFAPAMMVNVLTMFAMMGFLLFTSQYLQSVLSMSPLRAALWGIPASAAVGVAGGVASGLAKRVPPAYVIGSGLLISAVGLLILTRAQVHSSIGFVLTGMCVLTFGIGLAMVLIADLVIGIAPAERTGTASAVSETGNELGGALGIAVLGSIGAVVYRADMAAVVGPTGPLEPARETLGAAVALAPRLPGGAGDGLLSAAREAFTHGMHITAYAGAGLMALAGIVAIVLLRKAARPTSPDLPDAAGGTDRADGRDGGDGRDDGDGAESSGAGPDRAWVGSAPR